MKSAVVTAARASALTGEAAEQAAMPQPAYVLLAGISATNKPAAVPPPEAAARYVVAEPCTAVAGELLAETAAAAATPVGGVAQW